MGLIVDLFAGGGGASLGIEWALGRPVDIAINHDPKAIAMHKVNHPFTKHFIDNVWRVRPRDVCGDQLVDVLWMSPDCTHFSKAKGAAPKRDPKRSKRSRGLACVAIRWVDQVRPRLLCLENVEEWQYWGPVLRNGMPCPRRKSQTFKRWCSQMRRRGYRLEWWPDVRGCEHGSPTIRKRLVLVARCDNDAIVRPVRTHGEGLRPFRTAAECIDWSIPCPSIFERRKPLAEATQKRIARGIKRFVLENPHPFIVPVTHRGDDRVHSTNEPMRAITTAKRGEFSLVTPMVVGTAHGEGQGRGVAEWSAEEPLRTIMRTRDHALVTPFIARCDQSSAAHKNGIHGMDQPTRTATTSGAGAVIAPTLVQYHSSKREGDDRGRALQQPLPTQTTENRFGLVSAFLAQHNTGMTGHLVTKPLSTISSRGAQQNVVTAHLSHQYSSNTNGGQGDLRKPAKTIMTGGHHALVQAFLSKYFGTAVGQDLRQPLHTATAKARFGLVTIEGHDYQIVDIGMRMLTPRELFRAQGFPDSYIIDRGEDGVALTKTEQIRMCGNSVCPQVAEAVIRANAGFAMTKAAKRRAA